MQTAPRLHILAPGFLLPALFALVVALWARAPFVSAHLPYFYSEDEAHHFNRVAEMVKEGRWDPQYFHKPSLHFYLRMPVLGTAFLWNVREGHIRSVKEVRTRDPYGLAGYNFTASHPGIVKWNRSLSVLFSLGAVLLTVLIASEFSISRVVALGAGLLVAISPAHVDQSAVIGVDTPMGFFVLLSTWLALVFRRTQTIKFLWLAAVAAGFAVSTKYNALPILLVPAIAALIRPIRNPGLAVGAIGLGIVSFFAASPFILSNVPLFLDHFAYEIWHYGVEGHVGHSAEPGFAQAAFYWDWMKESAIGTPAALFLWLGLLSIGTQRKRRFVVGLAFGVLFFLLMVNQKANFTRNVMILVPWLALVVALAVDFLVKRPLIPAPFGRLAAIVLWSVLLVSPIFKLESLRAALREHHESRLELAQWLQDQDRHREIAVAGKLQLPKMVTSLAGISVIDERTLNPQQAYLAGYDTLALRASFSEPFLESGLYEKLKEIPGEREPQRIAENPAITLLTALPCQGECREKMRSLVNTIDCTIVPSDGTCHLALSGSERYLWLETKLAILRVHWDPKAPPSQLHLKFMSPWDAQSVHVLTENPLFISLPESGKWFDAHLPLSGNGSQELFLSIARISSPAERGLNSDMRRLGVAIAPHNIDPTS